MNLNHLYLPILLSGTLFLTGCGSAAEPGINPGGTESQQGDNEQRPNDGQGSESDAGLDTDNEPDTGNGSNTGSNTENGSDTDMSSDTDNGPDTDTGSDTDSDPSQQPDPVVIPGMAVLANISNQLELVNGEAKVQVSWKKSLGNNAKFWNVLVNGANASAFMATQAGTGQVQSGKTQITFNKAASYNLQVQLCQQASSGPHCSISQTFDLEVNEDPAQYVSQDGQTLFAAWNTNLCLSHDAGAVGLSACEDSVSQKWLIQDQKIASASDTRLCIDSQALQSGASLLLKVCNESEAQNWQYQQNSIRNQGWALDINTATEQVIIWSHHGGVNQQWLTQVPSEPDTPDDTQNNQSVEWTLVDVLPVGTYGSYEFKVPAAQNWVNTGLFLRKGQSAHINGSGQWSVKGGDLYDANGHISEMSRGCQLGELTARLGLYYKDPAITCIGREGTIVAHEDGILYVGAVVSNDLGETYEARKDAVGSLMVSVASEGETVPTIDHDVAPYFDYSQVTSGWVEIRSAHNILTLPVATAQQDAAKLTQASQRLDDIYQQHKTLRGKTPYHGQPIRWFADTKDAPGWMLAGNPVRMDPALVAANSKDRITLAAEPGNNDWGFAHELGHNFNFSGGDWYYTTFAGLEAWPNIFSLHAIEQLGLPARDASDCDSKKSSYLSKGVHENGLGGAWTGLCFLTEFTEQYGWEIWQNFYQKFNPQPGHGWGFLRDRLSDAAGEDVTPIFNSWNIPL